MRNIPVFVPYFDEEEQNLIAQSLKSGWIVQGPMVAEFERAVAAYEGVANAVAVTSCTTALHLALIAMGLESRHDVLVPSYTFVATANAVEYVDATPVLVDVRTDTYCIDAAFLDGFIDKRYANESGIWRNRETGKELFGIIPVGLFGLCADIPAINQIAARHNLKVLEDNACALGAHINGVHEGAFGNPTCLSFHARKSITTGEGGMVLTDDPVLADKMCKLRSHSASLSEHSRHKNHSFLMPSHNELGYNYRMTDIQGAMGVAQMRKFDTILEKKRALAARYDSALPTHAPGLIPQATPKGYYHTYQSYVVMVDYKTLGYNSVEEGSAYRNRLMAYLEERGISTRQGTHAIHMLGYYQKKYGYKPDDLPGAYACDKLCIALPMYARLTNDEQDYVVEVIAEWVKK